MDHPSTVLTVDVAECRDGKVRTLRSIKILAAGLRRSTASKPGWAWLRRRTSTRA
jgi:hypothetical protein